MARLDGTYIWRGMLTAGMHGAIFGCLYKGVLGMQKKKTWHLQRYAQQQNEAFCMHSLNGITTDKLQNAT